MSDGLDDYGTEQDVFGLLPQDESLDDEEIGGGEDGAGYSPLDKPLARGWGFTPEEVGGHEPLAMRLAREVSEPVDVFLGDGLGDASDTDGELIDDQVGTLRAGRLVWAEQDGTDPSSDLRATDVGIDGAGASAEEAAIHVVLDDDDRFV
ncbi:DUF5709 domain-containing protein [Myceligenerans pegani]|uniref:DUF5709 domain-containing protein n=1 Tax=Myceligenerans pegani TaxID=2776917 RepID=A0ABR9MYR0_9MICO|nr:DUF5709 domain-containing protein [Myceligenerans sp. TRM 65318]MBE1876528.1 hypothetical protein [Myceligenerans sp. TRM 65318]MBE3018799.1 hypothetical protein [Myceligenerans sp. TRM 65318]